MNYLNKIKKSLSLYNFRKGFDEEKIYGPLCLLGEIIVIFIFILKIISLNISIMLTAIIAFIFFIYFPFHKKMTPWFFIFGVPVGIIGIYALICRKVTFSEIKIVSIIWWVILSVVFLADYLALRKYPIKDVDITFNYFYRRFGFIITILLVPLAYVAFVIFAGSYFLFGKEHLILWIPIFFFFVINMIRVFIYLVLRNTEKK